MRAAFMETLHELAAENPAVCLVVGDLGFNVVENFRESFPQQFINAGVSEQNMTGLAAGMALSGRIVFTYSICNFPTLRALEQIRNDICYHRANVKVVSVGGGFGYGTLGFTHHATEDIAIMRALPGMTVVAPGDPVETRWATRALATMEGPAYLRLGNVGGVSVHRSATQLELGRALVVRDGTDITLISTGGMLETAVDCGDQLGRDGISARVISMHTVKPLDAETIRDAAIQTRLLFTLEDHSAIGGLGGAVAEVVAELRGPARATLHRFGMGAEFARVAGDQRYLRKLHRLDTPSILETIHSALEEEGARVR